MRRALLLLVVLSAFVAGCESKYKDPDPQAMGYDYYPLEIGQYRVYDVKETFYFNNTPSRLNYQLRERVDTSFTDQTGQLVYKVVRSKRDNKHSAWLDDSVMTVAKNERMVLMTKDNTKYVKLVFPVKENFKWEMDAYNNKVVVDSANKFYELKETYIYSNVGESFQLNGNEYVKTITVKPVISESSIKIDERSEKYAQGIGLIYRIFNRVNLSPCSSDNCPNGNNYKQDGHEREEILIEHGKL